MPNVQIHLGDCLDVLKTLPDASVHAVVTDPPAGIAFMGKDWDSFGGRFNPQAERDRARANRGPGKGAQPFAYSGSALPRSAREREAFVAFLAARMIEAKRVSKPGSYALVWALPRTSHWTATAIEDAGWRIVDRLAHAFGTGFPKHKSKLKPAVEDWWVAWHPTKGVTPLPGLDGCRVGTGGHLKWEMPRDMGYHGGSDSNSVATKAESDRYPPKPSPLPLASVQRHVR